MATLDEAMEALTIFRPEFTNKPVSELFSHRRRPITKGDWFEVFERTVILLDSTADSLKRARESGLDYLVQKCVRLHWKVTHRTNRLLQRFHDDESSLLSAIFEVNDAP